MKTTPVLIIFLFFMPIIALASNPSPADHYCDDVVAWQQWDKLLADSPMDDGISSLYAFRVGLCSMVKSGKIETIRAIRLFEGMRDAVLKGMHEFELERNEQAGKDGI